MTNGEIACFEQFFLFSLCLQMPSAADASESVYMWERLRCLVGKTSTFLRTGTRVDLVGTTKLPYGQIPVMVHNGEISLQTQSGKLVTIALDSHSYLFIDAIDGKSMKEVSYI